MSSSERVLVTGGAGFIGTNLVRRLVEAGHQVVVHDNFSRAGGATNLELLRREYGPGAVELVRGDLADFEGLLRATEGASRVYHLGGQVAVTASVIDPRRDFESNAVGTFNALEAARLVGDDPIFVYASTNKVYGSLDDAGIVESTTRYESTSFPDGVPESAPFDLHSPYGCSKGVGDHYVRDYHRVYGVRTVVMRQSCIVGPHQHGVEDQGWMAWLLAAARRGLPITIFGDGKQVRDVLDVDDLLDAYDAAVERIVVAAGEAFNIGGGPGNTVSVWCEFGPLLEDLVGRRIDVSRAPSRPGDQRFYVSGIEKAERLLGWRPRIALHDALARLDTWVSEHQP